MTKKKDSKSEKGQSQRFIDKARELGTDESAEAFDRVFKKIVPPLTRKKLTKKRP